MIPTTRTIVTAVLLVLAVGCGGEPEPEPPGEPEAAGEPDRAEASTPPGAWQRPEAEAPALTSGDTIPGSSSWTREDWEVLDATARWAWREGVDTLPVGERIATIGRRFVGNPYVPRTLDPPGPERLVVNLRVFDCVTYVESMMALAHFVRAASPSILDRPAAARDLYDEILTSLRYRGGERGDYATRLHYFSEWLSDNDARGWIALVGEELGGTADRTPIDFMTGHRDAYTQLADDRLFEEIGRVERRLSQEARYFLPQDELEEAADRIRTGDVIAATSTLEGLDVAHTGIALRTEDGVLRLMHAPLVGEAVQISESSLAARLRGIESQDGVMVARPLERLATTDAR